MIASSRQSEIGPRQQPSYRHSNPTLCEPNKTLVSAGRRQRRADISLDCKRVEEAERARLCPYRCAALSLDGLFVKVLFFIRSMVIGGSQRQVALLARGLIERGHEAAIVVFYTGGEIDVAREPASPRVISLEKSGRWDTIAPLARLRRLLRTECPDVVYAFHPPQAVLAALIFS